LIAERSADFRDRVRHVLQTGGWKHTLASSARSASDFTLPVVKGIAGLTFRRDLSAEWPCADGQE
jgi:hypothetical protein